MEDKIIEALDLNQSKFEENKIDSTQLGNAICGFVDKCTNFSDVEILIFYCLQDESGSGIKFAKQVVDKALLLRNWSSLKKWQRNIGNLSTTNSCQLFREV